VSSASELVGDGLPKGPCSEGKKASGAELLRAIKWREWRVRNHSGSSTHERVRLRLAADSEDVFIEKGKGTLLPLGSVFEMRKRRKGSPLHQRAPAPMQEGLGDEPGRSRQGSDKEKTEEPASGAVSKGRENEKSLFMARRLKRLLPIAVENTVIC